MKNRKTISKQYMQKEVSSILIMHTKNSKTKGAITINVIFMRRDHSLTVDPYLHIHNHYVSLLAVIEGNASTTSLMFHNSLNSLVRPQYPPSKSADSIRLTALYTHQPPGSFALDLTLLKEFLGVSIISPRF